MVHEDRKRAVAECVQQGVQGAMCVDMGTPAGLLIHLCHNNKTYQLHGVY